MRQFDDLLADVHMRRVDDLHAGNLRARGDMQRECDLHLVQHLPGISDMRRSADVHCSYLSGCGNLSGRHNLRGQHHMRRLFHLPLLSDMSGLLYLLWDADLSRHDYLRGNEQLSGAGHVRRDSGDLRWDHNMQRYDHLFGYRPHLRRIAHV